MLVLLIESINTIHIDNKMYVVNWRTFECWKRAMSWLWRQCEANSSLFQGGIAYEVLPY